MPFSMNRRTFLGTTGSMLLAGGVAARPLEAAEASGWPKLPPVKVYVVYLGMGGAWPKLGEDTFSVRRGWARSFCKAHT